MLRNATKTLFGALLNSTEVLAGQQIAPLAARAFSSSTDLKSVFAAKIPQEQVMPE